MNLSTRQLRALIYVANVRSFTRAAEKLFITQAGLSATIRDVEKELGFRVFERTTRSVALTRAGQQFLPVAQRALADLEHATTSIQSSEQVATSTLRVAATQLVAATLLPKACASLRKERPGTSVSVMDRERPEVQKLVESGEVDVGFGLFFRQASGLERAPLLSLDLVCVSHAARRERAVAQMPWAALRDEPLLGLFPDSEIQILVDSHLAKAGRNRPLGGPYKNFHTLLAMAEAGFGSAIVPSYILPLARTLRLSVRRMASPRVTLEFFQINKAGRQRAPAESDFVTHLVRSMRATCRLD